MRGDQLGRQWRILRAIEASPKGFTVNEIAQWEKTGFRTIYRDLEAAGFHLYSDRADRTNRWVFMDGFKFKIPPPFTLSEFISIYSYKDRVRKALFETLAQHSVIRRAFDLTRESRLFDLGHL
jgi:predicted DNA-binding transcriptional regulator YafY